MTANYCGDGRPSRQPVFNGSGGWGFAHSFGRNSAGDTTTLRANYRDGLVDGLGRAVNQEKAERKRLAKEREERKRCVCTSRAWGRGMGG